MSKVKTTFNVVEENTNRLAVLIDDDNVSAKDIKAILEEITNYGEATVKRIYGNFVSKNGQWKEVINAHAIKPMQQFAFTTGKNATDGFMIIDAMDLLYTERFDGFCLISSDSDFTALAIRLKEQGATVYGFGKKQTPEAFRNACSRFIYVENLVKDEALNDTIPSQTTPKQCNASEPNKVTQKTTTVTVKAIQANTNNPLPLEIITKIFENSDAEWLPASLLGQQWRLLQTDFDPRNYGCKKLTELVKKYDTIFETNLKKNVDTGQSNLYVKLKSN